MPQTSSIIQVVTDTTLGHIQYSTGGGQIGELGTQSYSSTLGQRGVTQGHSAVLHSFPALSKGKEGEFFLYKT